MASEQLPNSSKAVQPLDSQIRELLQAVDGLVVAADADTLRVSYVTGAVNLGWPPDDLAERFWSDLLHPDDSDKTAALFRATAGDGVERRGVHRVRTRDGRERWFTTRIRAICSKEGERITTVVALMTDISEPLSLATRPHHHRLVLEQLPGLVYTTDTDLRFTSGAGAAIAKLGLQSNLLIGVSIAEYFQTDDPNHPALGRHRRALAGESLTYDIDLNGVVLENHLGPLRDESGEIIGTLGIAHDVTEYRRADAQRDRMALEQLHLVGELRRRAAEWEAVLHSIVDGVVVFDNKGAVTFVNGAGARVTGAAGVARELTIQQREEMLELRQDGARVPSISERVLHGERVEPIEVAYSASRGGQGFARVAGAPLLVGTEQIGGVIVAHDITLARQYSAERERLLDKVTNQATRMQTMLDNLVDGVILISRSDNVEFVSSEARRLLALPAGPLTLADLNRAVVEESPIAMAHRCALDGEVVRNIQLHPRALTHSKATLRLNGGPVRGTRHEIVGAVIVVRDVSDVIEFDELKDQFIRVAAHELKTPVAVMKGYAQLLLRGGGTAPRGPLEAIDRGAKRIDRVVQELLDVSQLRLGTLSMSAGVVDLPELVTAVVAHTPSPDRHRVRIVRAAHALVRGDRHRLEFVIANLIDNAVRYSPHGGDVEVSVDTEDGFAVVAVRDRGVGIAREKQHRIFERFYRAHTDTPYDYGGIGVALALSREIIHRHGGTIDFESVEGQGSTFTFRVPLGGENGGSSNGIVS